MDLPAIRAKALTEDIDISEHIKQIRLSIEACPNGGDIFVPNYLIPHIEAYCDNMFIPLFCVAEGCVSVAITYTKLLDHEERR